MLIFHQLLRGIIISFTGTKVRVNLCLFIAVMFNGFYTVTGEGFMKGIITAKHCSGALMGERSFFT